jgi:hypothetical protein
MTMMDKMDMMDKIDDGARWGPMDLIRYRAKLSLLNRPGGRQDVRYNQKNNKRLARYTSTHAPSYGLATNAAKVLLPVPGLSLIHALYPGP